MQEANSNNFSRTFEESIDIIDQELQKRKHKWTLSAVPSIDFDDVCQSIRLHIWRKWHLYDQTRPFESWLNTVISHQIRNLLRNNYSRFVKPCLRCSCNEGNDLCSLYTTQCDMCPLLNKWLKLKKPAYDINLPVSMENHSQEVIEISNKNIDIDQTAKRLHEHMKLVLRPIEWIVYKSLYIDHNSEEKTTRLMGYKSKPNGRISGYKQLKAAQRVIMIKVRECIKNSDIDMVET